MDSYQPLRTALIAACQTNIENVKILVEHGVDINYTETKYNMQNALVTAFQHKKIDVIKYLIVDLKINTENIEYTARDGEIIEIRTYLRQLVYGLKSEDYKTKMKIVNYLMEQKINYWEYPVPRNMYHNYSPHFLKMY